MEHSFIGEDIVAAQWLNMTGFNLNEHIVGHTLVRCCVPLHEHWCVVVAGQIQFDGGNIADTIHVPHRNAEEVVFTWVQPCIAVDVPRRRRGAELRCTVIIDLQIEQRRCEVATTQHRVSCRIRHFEPSLHQGSRGIER